MILSLTSTAERLGIEARGKGVYRAIIRKLRRLEELSGRKILVASGVGGGRRYIVLERELDAALDGESRRIDDMANSIAEGVQRIESLVENLSVRVAKLERLVTKRDQT